MWKHGEKEREKSVWERPEAQLLFGNRPQLGQPMRLHDQKPHNQATKNHQLSV
jgi:hypothetical protein